MPSLFTRTALYANAALLSGIAIALIWQNVSWASRQPPHFNIFFVLFSSWEIPSLIVHILLISFLAFKNQLPKLQVCMKSRAYTYLASKLLSHPVLTIGILSALTYIVPPLLHPQLRTPFSMDEYSAIFGGKLILQGKILSNTPAAFRELFPAFVPISFLSNINNYTWWPGYLPGMSAIIATANLIGLENQVSAIVTALTMLLAHSILRTRGVNGNTAILSIILFLLSPQVITNAWTSYSMPAHLFFNTLWLWLIIQNNWLKYLAAPIGAYALTLHHYVPHLCFCLPFLFWFAAQRRYLFIGLILISYSVTYFGFIAWWYSLKDPSYLLNAITNFTSVPSLETLLVRYVHILALISWLPPLTSVFFLSGAYITFTGSEAKDPVLVCAIVGIFLSLGTHLIFPIDQGHGWGYRYMHANLISILLVSIHSIGRLSSYFQSGPLHSSIALSILMLLASIPYRAFEVSSETAPLARFLEHARTSEANIIVVEASAAWYAWDTIRNDPALTNRPIIVIKERLSPDALIGLSKRHDVEFIEAEELKSFGFSTSISSP